MSGTTVQIEVASLLPGDTPSITAEMQWLGEAISVTFANDGTTPGDVAGDNVWVAHLSGDTLRFLPIRIFAHTPGGASTELLNATESLDQPDTRLVYELFDRAGSLHAERVAAPWFGQPRVTHESERVHIAAAWTVLAFLTVMFLARRSGAR